MEIDEKVRRMELAVRALEARLAASEQGSTHGTTPGERGFWEDVTPSSDHPFAVNIASIGESTFSIRVGSGVVYRREEDDYTSLSGGEVGAYRPYKYAGGLIADLDSTKSYSVCVLVESDGGGRDGL
jgi:hypothetical protein